MRLRLLFLFLLLYLLFNFPFVVLKQYRKRVYLYKNQTALKFVNENPEIKHLVHITRNTDLHPLFLITDNPEDTLLAKFDMVYIESTSNLFNTANNIPTYAYIGDTIRIKTGRNRDTLIRITRKNNVVYIQDSIPIIIKGLPHTAYVIDTILSFSPYHGALRRYFATKPFLSFIAILYGKNTAYADNRVIKGTSSFQPVAYTIGKNLIILSNTNLYNPEGFFLAYHDTILPVPLRSITITDIKPDTTIAYIIGNRKYPLFFVKDHTGYITSPQIDILARKYPTLFVKIMNEMVSLTSTPLVYAYPDKHIYRFGDIATVKVMTIPSGGLCSVRRKEVAENIVATSSLPLTYSFIPNISDTTFVIQCGKRRDTVRIIVNTTSEKVAYNKQTFIKSIKSNSYILKRPLLGTAINSTLYYILLLSTLIIIWIFEKKKAIRP